MTLFSSKFLMSAAPYTYWDRAGAEGLMHSRALQVSFTGMALSLENQALCVWMDSFYPTNLYHGEALEGNSPSQ